MSTKYFYPVLVVAAALLARPGPCLGGAFAWDDADGYEVEGVEGVPYVTDAEFGPDQNGGGGFQAWVDLRYPGYGASFLLPLQAPHAEQPIDGGYSWCIDGNLAFGRGLQSPLAAGTWTFYAAHNANDQPSENRGFSGFILKTTTTEEFGDKDYLNDELLRFGFRYDWDLDFPYGGLCVSVNGGETYEYLGEDWVDVSGDKLEYSVTWDGAGNYTLFVQNLNPEKNGPFTTSSGTMPTGEVAMLGTLIYGGTLDPKSLTFDAYTVAPEPVTSVPVLALAALAFALLRRDVGGRP